MGLRTYFQLIQESGEKAPFKLDESVIQAICDFDKLATFSQGSIRVARTQLIEVLTGALAEITATELSEGVFFGKDSDIDEKLKATLAALQAEPAYDTTKSTELQAEFDILKANVARIESLLKNVEPK